MRKYPFFGFVSAGDEDAANANAVQCLFLFIINDVHQS